MPYIKQTERIKYHPTLYKLLDELNIHDATEGELNYIITKIIEGYVDRNGHHYKNYNAAVGILESSKLEFYRRVVSTYEDKKIKENGEVYGQSSS